MDGELGLLLADLQTRRAEVLRRLGGLSEEQLERKVEWAGVERTVRFLLHRFADHEKEHIIQIRKARQNLGLPQSEAQMILSKAEETRGELIGALLGVSDEHLSKVTKEGEWTIREVLQHLCDTEKSFLDKIERACAKID
ncbi:MAG: DinB family protein [Chloroflexi bacterium]|nr:DinB family protein [Chloroflexota bacterium]MCL5076282.1 DinB family protein [Chloroflexota bacterium]